MALSIEVLAMLSFTLLAFWGVASWALVKTLRQEGRKVDMLEEQDKLDTYSPEALAELREWIEKNPEDPVVDRARKQYNDCVDALEQTDHYFYDWSDREIENLERL